MENHNQFDDQAETDADEINFGDELFDSVSEVDKDEEPDFLAARIHDYRLASLEKYDPLEAVLGGINATLLQCAAELGPRIHEALASAPTNLEAVKLVLPSLDAHLRLTRQIDRFAQCELRIEETRAKFANAHSPSVDQLRQYNQLKRRNHNPIPTSNGGWNQKPH